MMAESSVIDRSSNQVVLRVKRKRTEDPTEALVIHSKIPKQETDHDSIFKFCGRLEPGRFENANILDVVKSYKDHTQLFKPNPLSRLSLTDKERVEKKQSSTNQRYKLLSTLRCLKWSDDDDGSITNNIPLWDAVNDNDAMESDTAIVEEKITCNSSVMIREKIKHTGGGDFVYDIYYTNRINMDTLDNVVLCPYEAELVHDIIDSDEEERYSDDSNDEDNWRNDYPDEDNDSTDNSNLSDNPIEYRYKNNSYYYDEYCWEEDEENET